MLLKQTLKNTGGTEKKAKYTKKITQEIKLLA